MSTEHTTYTAADFDHITAEKPAPCETWLVAINNRYMVAYTMTPPGGDAVADMKRAKKHYADDPELMPVLAMTFEQLMQWERKRQLDSPNAQPHAITKEDFWEMLEVLPPMQWERGADFEHFKMSEFTTGSWTNQYARHGDKYACKMVDVQDKSTWLTADQVDAANS